VFNGVGGSWRFDSNFQDNVQSAADDNVQNITLTRGAIDLNGYTIQTNAFLANGSDTRTLTMGAGVLQINGNDTTYPTAACRINGSNLTINKGTGEIRFASANSKTFDGGSNTTYSFPNIRSSTTSVLLIKNGYGGTLKINNLLVAFTSTQVYEFPSGSTTYFDNFTLAPIAGRSATIRTEGAAASTHNLVLNSGIASCQRLIISWSSATPATDTWYAGATSTDGGNNSGWIFENAPQGKMFLLFAAT
jgi:hypothetical protein